MQGVAVISAGRRRHERQLDHGQRFSYVLLRRVQGFDVVEELPPTIQFIRRPGRLAWIVM